MNTHKIALLTKNISGGHYIRCMTSTRTPAILVLMGLWQFVLKDLRLLLKIPNFQTSKFVFCLKTLIYICDSCVIINAKVVITIMTISGAWG